MSNKIFENDCLNLNSTINGLLTEKNIEGFIFNFFNKYENNVLDINNLKCEIKLNKDYKSEILYNSKSYSICRDSKLFDKIKNEIILRDDEIELINSSYFESKLDLLYKNISKKLTEFHIKNKELYNDEMIFFYDEILNRMKDNFYNSYNSGLIKNFNELNINYFRTLTKDRFTSFEKTIKLFRQSLEIIEPKNIDMNWINIFKKAEDYYSFKNLINERNIINHYLDISFFFFQLLDDEKIYKVPHLYFVDWLFRNQLINQSQKEKFEDKRGFEKNSHSESRLNIYNKYF
ncbi:hypothetical protein [Flavobacterium covae]|uniref:hypothetical protein n=1 Tax=Flavobacterium covae TaxID=2906076 RepID=UPI000745CE78|nr:hypothetical protein [Flavobacterium covae]AMA49653.1 hypothetical protein AWN65_09365 [Flavobacterium covae]MCJ1809488.1 hypothetical protein [Flavobacterium covae]